jgi:hypothetical protein
MRSCPQEQEAVREDIERFIAIDNSAALDGDNVVCSRRLPHREQGRVLGRAVPCLHRFHAWKFDHHETVHLPVSLQIGASVFTIGERSRLAARPEQGWLGILKEASVAQ